MTDKQVIHDEIESIVKKIMREPLTIDEGLDALTGEFDSEDLETKVSKAIADEVTALFMRQLTEQAEKDNKLATIQVQFDELKVICGVWGKLSKSQLGDFLSDRYDKIEDKLQKELSHD